MDWPYVQFVFHLFLFGESIKADSDYNADVFITHLLLESNFYIYNKIVHVLV